MLKVGNKVKFDKDKIFRWTVRAISHPFVICTTAGDVGYYTILNLDKNVRGPDNCYGVGYATEEKILEAIGRLVSGDLEISRRNSVPLVIAEVR